MLKEFHSEGPVTEFTNILVALNNLAAIVCFEVVSLGGHAHQWRSRPRCAARRCRILPKCARFSGIGRHRRAGHQLRVRPARRGRWLVLLVAMSTLLLGLCEMFMWPYMLTFIAVGTVVANASDSSKTIVRELDHLNGLLAVVFFGVHGAHLNLYTFFLLGWIGGIYIVCRTAGKCLGIFTVATMIGEPREIRLWLGPALLAQAGAAIALAQILKDHDPILGGSIHAIILGSVVVFEIIGPILIRQSVLQSGEVPLAHAIHHTSHTPLGQLRDVRDRLLTAVGRDPYAKVETGELTITTSSGETSKALGNRPVR